MVVTQTDAEACWAEEKGTSLRTWNMKENWKIAMAPEVCAVAVSTEFPHLFFVKTFCFFVQYLMGRYVYFLKIQIYNIVEPF